METGERYTPNSGDVDVYALYPWRRQSPRHSSPPRLSALPSSPGAGERRGRHRHVLRAGREAGEAGPVAMTAAAGCCCLELQLESAEAAVEPEQSLPRRLPAPGPERVPRPLESQGHPLGCPGTPQPRVPSQDRCVLLPGTPDRGPNLDGSLHLS